MKIAISLLFHNDIVLAKPCIESLLNSDLKNYEFKFFIIDNASNQECKDYLNSLPCNKWLQFNDTNQGIVIPRIEIMNKILEEEYDYTIEIHADMLFPEKWLGYLVELMDDNTALTMPYILNNPNRILSIDEMNTLIEQFKTDEIVENVRQVHPWLLNNKVIKKIGYYDPIFSPQNCEDDDLMWNIMKNNYKTKATKKSIVVHYGGKTRTYANIENNLEKSIWLFDTKNGIHIYDMIKRFTLHPVITNY